MISSPYRRVVFIVADGAGTFYREADTPNIDRIFKDGAFNYEVKTALPSITPVCFTSILTGAMPKAHRIYESDGLIAMHYPPDSPIPTVCRRIKEAAPEKEVGVISAWPLIADCLAEEGCGISRHSSYIWDSGVVPLTEEYLQDHDPDFLFIAFAGPDISGHDHGYGSEQQLKTIHGIDTFIGQIYDLIAQKGGIEDTLFLLSADHGGRQYVNPDGTTFHGHGGTEPAEHLILFAAAGKTVRPGVFGEMFQWDSAAVVLHALGIEIPEFDEKCFAGQLPEGMFTDVTPRPRHKIEDKGEKAITSNHKVGYDGGLSDAMGTKPEMLISFEDNYVDMMGNVKVDVHDSVSIYPEIGIRGCCASTGSEGYIECPELHFGKDSFTLSLWYYFDGSAKDPVVMYGTTEMASLSRGFTFSVSRDGFSFRLSDGEETFELTHAPEEEFQRKWYNTILVVDREAGEIRHYINFRENTSARLPEALQAVSFDNVPFHLGEAKKGVYCKSYITDEIALWRHALTEEEIADLEQYYADAEW